MLDKDVSKYLQKKRPVSSKGFERFCLIANPFPLHNVLQAEIYVDVAGAKDRLVEELYYFDSDTKSRTLFVQGPHGSGKTTLLKYFHSLVKRLNEVNAVRAIFPIMYVQQPGDTFIDFYREIMRDLNDNFLEDVCAQMGKDYKEQKENPYKLVENKYKIKNQELIRALSADTRASDARPRFIESDSDRLYIRRLVARWLSGSSLSTAQREQIGVDSNLDTASAAIKNLHDLTRILRILELCRGMVLLIDEFELIFSGKLSKANVVRYTEDIRHLIENIQEGFMMVFASVPWPSERDPLKQYPALVRRLNASDPIELGERLSYEQALLFTREFISHERDKFARAKGKDRCEIETSLGDPYVPLSEEIVQGIFQQLESERTIILPSTILPVLHRKVNKVVQGET